MDQSGGLVCCPLYIYRLPSYLHQKYFLNFLLFFTFFLIVILYLCDFCTSFKLSSLILSLCVCFCVLIYRSLPTYILRFLSPCLIFSLPLPLYFYCLIISTYILVSPCLIFSLPLNVYCLILTIVSQGVHKRNSVESGCSI